MRLALLTWVLFVCVACRPDVEELVENSAMQSAAPARIGAVCRNEGAGVAAAAAVRRDSAGVQVVETPPESIPRATLGEPVLVIGTGGGPDQELYQVRTPWLDEDGRLILANSGTLEIRFYDRNAAMLRSVGGQGHGPGEYQMIAWVRPWRGDSLAAWDGFADRLTILDERGAPGRTLRLEAAGVPAPRAGAGGPATGGLGAAAAVDVLPDGRLLGRVGGASAMPGDTSAVLRDTVSYRVFDADGKEVAHLADVLDGESFRFVSGGSRSVGPLPFGKSSSVAALTHAVDRAVVAVADNAGFQVRLLSVDGQVLRIGRVPLPARSVTAAMRADYRAKQEATLGDLPAFAQRARTAKLEATPWPDSLPAHGEIVVGGGCVWLERYQAQGADVPGEWIGFDVATGVATSWLTIPNGSELAGMRGDTAVVIATDDLDVERVVVAPFVR